MYILFQIGIAEKPKLEILPIFSSFANELPLCTSKLFSQCPLVPDLLLSDMKKNSLWVYIKK